MRNIAIIDESFDSNASPGYHLSIQYGGHYCTFAVLDTVSMRYLAFKNFWFSYPIPVKEQGEHFRSLLRSESFLMRRFKSVYFMYLTPLSLLVPSPLFHKEEPQTFFRFSAELLPTDRMLFRKIPIIDAYSVFPVPQDVADQVNHIQDNVQFFHQSCPQITEAIAKSNAHSEQARVFACINPGFVEITIIRAGQLILQNSFIIRNTNDLIFFILYMYEQFSLSQEESPVELSGYLEMYPGTEELLNRYIKTWVMPDISQRFSFSNTFNDLKNHHYSHFLNLARCE
jgi:hypothetical protein